MRKIKLLLLRKRIGTDDYMENRMNQMSDYVNNWLDRCKDAGFRPQREFYVKMSDIYFRRFKWYANRRKATAGAQCV